MSDKLLPCPFCGAYSAELIRGNGEESLRPFWYIACLEDCGMSRRANNKKDAIAAWNRRPAQPAQKQGEDR